jgi:hypothetical protein
MASDQYYNNVSLLLHGDHPADDPNYTDVVLLLNGDGTGTDIKDLSKNPKAITVVGNTTISTVQSKFSGSSLYFDGSGDYLTVPDGVISLSENYTFECWVFPTVAPSVGYTLFDARSLGAQIGLNINLNANGSIGAYIHPNSYNSAVGVITYGAWNHIAYSRSGNIVTAYINGISVLTFTHDAPGVGGSRCRISGNVDSNYNLLGYIDDLRITKGVARYTANFTPPTVKFPHAYLDKSPTPKIVLPFGNAQSSIAQSKFGGSSLYFDGAGDYLTTPNNPAFDLASANFTIEAWIYVPTPASAYKRLVSNTKPTLTVTSDESFILEMDTSNRMTAAVAMANNTFPVALTEPSAVTASTWIHYAFVRNGDLFSLYRDGVSVASATVSGVTVSWSATHSLYIGRWASSTARDFIGYVDELRITKGVARYTANFTPPIEAFAETALSYLINGSVLDFEGLPTERTIRCYHRGTGALIGEIVSDAITGAYSFTLYSPDEHYVVALDDSATPLLNDLIVRVIPEENI